VLVFVLWGGGGCFSLVGCVWVWGGGFRWGGLLGVVFFFFFFFFWSFSLCCGGVFCGVVVGVLVWRTAQTPSPLTYSVGEEIADSRLEQIDLTTLLLLRVLFLAGYDEFAIHKQRRMQPYYVE